MGDDASSSRDRAEEYWDWFAVALFLLVTVDMLTSIGAAVEYGVAHELNPLMRVALRQGPLALMALNLLAVVLAAASFNGVVEMARRTPASYSRYLETTIEVWLGLLVTTGLVLFANNLAVIVHGRPLL